MFLAGVTIYFLYASCKLQLIARVPSYFLTISYNKNKDDKTVYDNKVMIKNIAQKMEFRKLWIWSHLLKKSLMENFVFCAAELPFGIIFL